MPPKRRRGRGRKLPSGRGWPRDTPPYAAAIEENDEQTVEDEIPEASTSTDENDEMPEASTSADENDVRKGKEEMPQASAQSGHRHGPGRGRGRGRRRRRGGGRGRWRLPWTPAAAEENGVEKGKEEMPQTSADENGTEETIEIQRPTRKRRRDPVADPSPLEPRATQLWQRRTAPVVADTPNKVRKKKESTSTMCHQCQKGSGKIVQCLSCQHRGYLKRYCMACMTRWYPELTEDDFVNNCPSCRNSCNCKACLRKNIIEKVDMASGCTRLLTVAQDILCRAGWQHTRRLQDV